MPVFHTKTIESILEPVAQQVSRLVILHEEAEDGNAMPDLSRPVQAVSKAVENLVRVGRETCASSDDQILKQDMPAALQRVTEASRLLEEASLMLKTDPYSVPARKKLIEGSRGILQGTSALLLCFDESEVRKIIRECKKVLDYLAVAEVIETMEDLVQFVKDLSPCLTKVSRDVDAREKELTHQIHREILIRCLEQVKGLAPILICSMKIFIQILHQGGKGVQESAENRNYLCQRMTDEINEIIRVLQLTTYDEDEWDADNLTSMKKAHNAIEGKIQPAQDWLADPRAIKGGVGEKSVRQILEYAQKVAERSLPQDRDVIKKACGDIASMTDALAELRQEGKGATPQAQALAKGISNKLHELNSMVNRAIQNVEKSGIQQPAHTVSGRVEQAQRWLAAPYFDDKGLGQNATRMITAEGRKVAELCSGPQRGELVRLSDEVDQLTHQLADLCRRGQGNTPQAQALAKTLSQKLHQLKNCIQSAMVNRVVEDFIDISTPLKQFTDAVLAPEGTPNREANFHDKAHTLTEHSLRAANTARMVAAAGGNSNKKTVESLVSAANQVESLTPQLVNAGKIRMEYPGNKQAADEHFDNLKKQYADSLQRMRNLVDEATDTVSFIKVSEDNILRHTNNCEEAIQQVEPQKMVDNTSNIARLANRVLMLAQQESENSEDMNFIQRVNTASDSLQGTITPMVQDAKTVAMNPQDNIAVTHWRQANRALITAVGEVRHAVTVYPEDDSAYNLPEMGQLHIGGGGDYIKSYQPLSSGTPQVRSSSPKLVAVKEAPLQSTRLRTYSPPLPPTSPPKQNIRPLQHGRHPSEFESDIGNIFDVDFNEIFNQSQYESDPGQSTSTPKRKRRAFVPQSVSETQQPSENYQLFSRKVTASTRPPGTHSPVPQAPSPVPDRSSESQGYHSHTFSPINSHYEGYPNEYYSSPFGGPAYGAPASDLESLHYQSYYQTQYREPAPPRPPLPGEHIAPPRPPPPETDDEDEMHFPVPQANQPIMMAAHGLHQEVKQWSSKDNEIIAAAKRMAILMAKLSQLVRGEGGNKKDLIACAKAIAESSEGVTRLAKELARQCTDKRMRTNLLQVCERIPTIGTQLKILSTVKATMLGAQEPIPSPDGSEIQCGSEEDQEATEMLVGNAQNLMQSVKETVRAAEAASIKIRTDSGVTLRWVRKRPWYQ